MSDKTKLAAAIRATKLDGATGLITFDANGQAATPVQVEMKTVRDGKWVDYTAK